MLNLMRLSSSDMKDFKDIMIILLVVGIIGFFVFLIFSAILGVSKAKKFNSDEMKNEKVIYGTILEKNVENKTENSGMYNMHFTIEWLLIEDVSGIRYRVRNIKPKEIFMAVGDKGIFCVRGETVYSFTRGEFTKQ